MPRSLMNIRSFLKEISVPLTIIFILCTASILGAADAFAEEEEGRSRWSDLYHDAYDDVRFFAKTALLDVKDIVLLPLSIKKVKEIRWQQVADLHGFEGQFVHERLLAFIH